MPVLNDKNMRNHTIGGSAYGFSAARIDHLGASEYTLVVIAADVSGSVAPFRDQIERCVKQIVRACRRSVRADNLMLRLVGFNGRLNEVHGFKVLADCNEDDYDGAIAVGGSTALFDAAHNAIESIAAYGRDLASRHFAANAILFVVSDGEDNASTMTAASVGDALRELIGSEAVESTVAVLVGVGVTGSGLSSYLARFERDARFDQYVELADADAGTLAQLADFVGQSVIAQSRALGSGVSQGLSY